MLKKRVLVVGSGKRVQTTILPALGQLPDFELVGVFSKTEKQLVNSGFSFTTHTNFDGIDFESVDIIMVAVTTAAVPQVLKKLIKKDVGHIVLMLDTPVLTPRGLGATNLFKHFKRVLATEDSITLPNMLAAKAIVESDKIGRIKAITFDHSAYRYHGLASLRMLLGIDYFSKIRFKKNNGQFQLIISLGRVSILINEPRDYPNGKISIEGERGRITDYETPGEGSYLIENQKNIDMLKIEGLKILILAALEESSPYHYLPWDALYDSLCLKITQRIGFFFDFPLGRRTSIFKIVLKCTSALLSLWM